MIFEPTELYQLLSKSAENAYFFSSCKSFNGGIGEDTYRARINPNISDYNFYKKEIKIYYLCVFFFLFTIDVIIAVLINKAINNLVTVVVICFVIVEYLLNSERLYMIF